MRPVREDLRIQGQQIYLRPITAEDTELAVRWRNQPVVVENFIYRKPVSREDHINWLENKVFKGLVHQFIVCRNEDDLPLGSIYLQNFEEENRKAEWGIYLGEEQAYGKGIGTEFFKQLDIWAEKENITRLELTVICENKIAKHLYEKNGFEIEGIKRNSVFRDGKYLDEFYMAKMK